MNTLKQRMIKAANVVDRAFTKEHLYKHFVPVLEKVLKKHREEMTAHFDFQFRVGLGKGITSLPKHDLVKEVAPLFAELFSYRYFLEALDPEVESVWNYLVFNNVGYFDKLKKELEVVVYRAPVEKRYSSYSSMNQLPKFQIFPGACDSSWGGRVESSNFLFLPDPLCDLLSEYYELPEEAELMPLEEEPKGDFMFLDGDIKLFEELPRLALYYEQRQISYTNRMRPVANGLLKITRTLHLAEFFPKSSQNIHKRLRTGFLAAMIPYLYSVKKPNVSEITWIQQFFQKTYENVPTPPMTLPDVKGMSQLDPADMRSIEASFFEILRRLPENSWVSMDNIVDYCKYKRIHLDAVRPVEANRILTIEVKELFDERIIRGQESIRTRYYHNAIGLPTLRGTFFLFAAFGLCDLVYDEVSEEEFGMQHFSSWDKLRAVRRTSFGDFVCGLKDTYERRESKNFQTTLSTETLLITTNDPNAGLLFENFAQQMSPSHFRVDEAIFLKNVRSIADLKNKVSMFKHAVSTPVPPNWESFFQGLLLKIDPLTLFEPCTVFQVPKENQPLIQLLARDQVLKSLIHKAEGYLILVPKKNQAAFKKRLADFGYLLT